MPKMRWLIIWMCFLANAISYIDRANLAIAAPSIRAELGIDAATMGWVLGAFFWTYAVMQLPAGWFIDKVGVRVSLAFAVTWWSLFTVATGAARGVSQFIGARLMLGVGEAASLPSFTKTAFNWFPRSERGFACAIFNSGSTAGSALSLPLVTALIAAVGWRGAFVVTGALGVIWALAWWFIYRDPEQYRAIAPREVEALLAQRSVPAAVTEKISWLDLFRYRSIWGLMIGLFCLNFAIYFFITWFPSYLLQARGFSLASLGTWGAAGSDGGGGQLDGRLYLRSAAQVGLVAHQGAQDLPGGRHGDGVLHRAVGLCGKHLAVPDAVHAGLCQPVLYRRQCVDGGQRDRTHARSCRLHRRHPELSRAIWRES